MTPSAPKSYHNLQIAFETDGMTEKQMVRTELDIERDAGAVSTSGGWKGSVRVLDFRRWDSDGADRAAERVAESQPKTLKMMIRVSTEPMEEPAWV